MDETSTEVVTFLALFLANILAGALPILLVKKCLPSGDPEHECQKIRTFAFLLHFGMGSFMSLCLMVLLPQCRDLFELHEHSHLPSGKILIEECPQDDHHHGSFPFPEFVILCGFFATFALQELLHHVIYHCRRKDHPAAAHPRVRFCSCAKRHTECNRTFKVDNPEQTLFGMEKRMNTEPGISEENDALFSATDQVPDLSSNLLRSSILAQPIPNYGSVATLTDVEPDPPLVIANNGNVTLIQRPHSPVQDKNILTSNVLLVVSLSYSALCSGLRIGRSFQSSSWEKLIADSLQQVTFTFVVGCVGMSQSESVSSAVSYVAVLSAMSPLGMALDMLAGQRLQAVSGWVWGVAEALVCGSLLYLTFCDFLRRSQMRDFPHVIRFVAFTSGSALIALLQYASVTF